MVSLDPYKESGCVVYLDPFGCCALRAICIYTLWPRERVRLYISVARKFSEAIRQVNPGPLARLQSSQQQAQSGSENMCTWQLSFFRTFFEKIKLERLCLWMGILLRPKTIARLIFLKCVGFSGTDFIGQFIGCRVTFRFPSGLAIPTQTILIEPYFLKAMMNTYIWFCLAVFILFHIYCAFRRKPEYLLPRHLFPSRSAAQWWIAEGWMDHLHVCTTSTSTCSTSPPALSVSCQPGVSTGSDTVQLQCQILCTFNY